MKVKSLYPTIVTDNVEETLKFYENLGFSKKHDLISQKNSHIYVVSNGDLQIEIIEKVDIGPNLIKTGLFGLRMNVDDIEEAYAEAKEKGYTVLVPPVDTPYSRNMMICDDQGINITLIQHIRKKDKE